MSTESTAEKDPLLAAEAAQELGVSVFTVRQWIKAGELMAYTLPGRKRELLIDRSEVEALREKRRLEEIAHRQAMDGPWQTDVMSVVLGVLDWHELTEEGLEKSTRRLKRLHAPYWLEKFRRACIERMQRGGSVAYLPTFVIRCETAIVGICLYYRTEDACRIVYRRALFRFLREVLQPFAEWAESDSEQRRTDYRFLSAIYAACESTDRARTSPWPELMEKIQEERKQELSLERDNAMSAASACIEAFFGASYTIIADVPAYMVEMLERQHKWRVDGDPDSPQDYTELVAQAFLTAIEAECPEPEWMPRI